LEGTAFLPTKKQEGHMAKYTNFTAHHSVELRIKAMSLAAEARIIRRQEKRLFKAARHHPGCRDKAEDLFWHRLDDVRPEARDTFLAYGFLKSRPYKDIEAKRYSDPDWDNIARMIDKYGMGDIRDRMQHFERWKSEAGEPAPRLPRAKRVRPSKDAPAPEEVTAS
jgi:hypothetical protein